MADTSLSVQAILNRVFDPATNTISSGGSFHETFTNPAAASITAIHAATSGNGTDQTISTAITQPDYPRALSITDSSVATASGYCTITGTDIAGNTVTETLEVIAGTTVSGAQPFAKVTSYTVPSTVGGGVSALYISSGGSGFPSSGELTITGGDGTATFTFSANLIGGESTLIYISSGGGGYPSSGELTLASPETRGDDCTFTFAASAADGITAIDTITASGTAFVSGVYYATGSTGYSSYFTVASANGVTDEDIVAVDTITASGLGYVTSNWAATTGSTGSSCYVDINNVTESTLSLGTTNKLGMARTNITFRKINFDGADEAVSAATTNSTYGTVKPAHALDGSHDFDFWYTT